MRHATRSALEMLRHLRDTVSSILSRVEVRVQVPSRLSKRQRELLQELETLTPVENKPQRRSLLSRVKEIFGS